MNTVVFVVFAKSTNKSVIYLTCDTLPDVPVAFVECITDIESIITNLEGFCLRVSKIFSIFDSESTDRESFFIPSLVALSWSWFSVSSHET
jgi:hypothetical protein